MLTANEIRGGFIEFFRGKGHEFVPSSPIVPINDDTLLFANAGMNQFKDIFLGLVQPQFPRAANSQKCLRVSGKHNDLEEVGKDTYHHTFFEMLGNWSFGDYFKAEAIEWAWELLTQVWGIDPGRLWATVFAGDVDDGIPKDEEAVQLWTKLTSIPAERVRAFGKKDNFWEMGTTGPCGPCSEIHIDLGPDRCDKKAVHGHICGVNTGCSRFIELWNLVFIQYNREEEGRLVPLKAKYVDTGAGLERVVSVLQDKKSNYDTDLFTPVINHVSGHSGHKYTSQLNNKTDNAFRVIADHIRALVFAIADGATPSNEGRGYVIRRILRRAARFGRELGMHEPFMYKMVPVVSDVMGDAFGEVRERADYISTVIGYEEESFGRTLDRGIEIFNSAAAKAMPAKQKTISGEDAFQLYDTYGFPLDLTVLMAQERDLNVDTARFNKLMDEQRQRARSAQKTSSLITALTDTELPVTEDIHKYSSSGCDAVVIGLIGQDGFKTAGQVCAGSDTGVVLDRTCFYAESGGQLGDKGTIESQQGSFAVEDTAKIASCIVHRGKVAKGTLAVGDKVRAIVDKDRDATRKNHTATHLLQWALQAVCGKSVAQQGSLVGPDYLRFDFTCRKALTDEEIKNVERLIREKIDADMPVTCAVMPKKDAQKLGAMALFGEKYDEQVRVVAIGASSTDSISEAFSREFCGGTHVDRIGVIGGFKVIKEESISAGVRRITALTGEKLAFYYEKRSQIVDELSKLLKAPDDSIVERVNQLIADNKKLSKELKSASKGGGADVMGQARDMLDNCIKIQQTSVVIGRFAAGTVEQAREAIDMVRKKAGSAAIVFAVAGDDTVNLFAGMTDDLVKKGLSAGELIKTIAPIVGGGGGGRPQMAQAGGKDASKIDEALSAAAEFIKGKLD